jgi:hypothetical protein
MSITEINRGNLKNCPTYFRRLSSGTIFQIVPARFGAQRQITQFANLLIPLKIAKMQETRNTRKITERAEMF